MNKEKFLAKGVSRKYENGEVLFEVSSLQNHYEGISFHEVDVVDGFIKPSDVFGGDIREIEVCQEEFPVDEMPLASGMTFEDAEKLMDIGELIALPEWGGFWLKSVKTGETIVLTKEGEIINTPQEEYKERNDWVTVEATPEQQKLLEEYWASLEVSVDEIAVVSEVVSVDETPAEIVVVEEVVAPSPTKKKTRK